MMDVADAADDEDGGDEGVDDGGGWRRELRGAPGGAQGGGLGVMEPGGTVLAGNVSFPAP